LSEKHAKSIIENKRENNERGNNKKEEFNGE